MRIFYIFVALLFLFPSVVMAEVCFCNNGVNYKYNYEAVSGNGVVAQIPACGDTTLVTVSSANPYYQVTDSSGHLSAVQVMYWDDVGASWVDMDGETYRISPSVHDWVLNLQMCPADKSQPLVDSNEDTDNDTVPDVCDPWPDQNNQNTSWQPILSWSNGGVTYAQAGNEGNMLDLGDCSGDASILVGYSSTPFADLMNEACDPDNPSSFAPRDSMPQNQIPTGGGDNGTAGDNPNPPAPYVPPDTNSTVAPPDDNSPAPYVPPDTAPNPSPISPAPFNPPIDQGPPDTASGSGYNPPAPGPEPSPDKDADYSATLDAIAHNTGELVTGQNEVRNYLSDIRNIDANGTARAAQIAENTGKIVSSQGDIKTTLVDTRNITARVAARAVQIADNTGSLVSGQNEIRGSLARVDNSTAVTAARAAQIAQNSGTLVSGQNDMRSYLAALQNSNSKLVSLNTQISQNTGTLVSGQNDMRSYLAAIQKNGAYTRADVHSIKSSAQSIDTNVKTLADDLAASSNASQTGVADVDEVVNGLDYAPYTADDIPDANVSQNAFETAVSNFKSNSQITGVTNNLGVSLTSPTSSFSINVWGKNIIFDFAPYEGVLDTMGAAFLALCYLAGFFIVLRG